MPNVPGTAVEYNLPDWMKNALTSGLQYAFTEDVTPDLLFEDPFGKKPLMEMHGLEDAGGAAEQLIVPQTRGEWALEAVFGPILGSVVLPPAKGLRRGITRAIGTRGVRAGEELMTSGAARQITRDEGILKSFLASDTEEYTSFGKTRTRKIGSELDPELPLNEAEEIGSSGQTGKRVAEPFTGLAGDQPIVRKKLAEAQERIGQLMGGPLARDTYSRWKPKRAPLRTYKYEKSAGETIPGYKLSGKEEGMRSYADLETAEAIRGRELGEGTVTRDYSGWKLKEVTPNPETHPETGLIGGTAREGKFHTKVRKDIDIPFNPWEKTELELLMGERRKLKNQLSIGRPYAETVQPEGVRITMPTSEYVMGEKAIVDEFEEFRRSVLRAIDPTDKTGAATTSLLIDYHKQRLGNLSVAKEFMDTKVPDGMMPSTRKIIDAEIERTTYFSKRNKIENFPNESGFFEFSGADRYVGDWVPTADYVWTYVRSLRERAIVQEGLGNLASASVLHGKADSMKTVAKSVELNKGWSDEVLDALGGEGTMDMSTATVSDVFEHMAKQAHVAPKTVRQAPPPTQRFAETGGVAQYDTPMGNPRTAYPTSRANQRYWFNEADAPFSRAEVAPIEGPPSPLKPPMVQPTPDNMPMLPVPSQDEAARASAEWLRAWQEAGGEAAGKIDLAGAIERFNRTPPQMKYDALQEILQGLTQHKGYMGIK